MATILVIEDDHDMRELERAALCHSGYEVVTATNGRDGLRRLAEVQPCLILLDLMMPVMDGLAFLEARLRDGLAIDVPVYCVSAAGQEMLNEARSRGATACIAKPVDLEQLCDLVAEVCGGR
jgi:CheY-like chemotaxis protein